MPVKRKCPKCGRNQKQPQGDTGEYWCKVCQMRYDDDPDEGGNYSDFNPTWRLEKSERLRKFGRVPSGRKFKKQGK